MKKLVNLLRSSSIPEEDIDGQGRLNSHARILDNKQMLREVFTEFHHKFKQCNHKYFSGKGIEVELGCGISPIRDSYPDVLATDVVHAPHLDRVIDSQAMTFADGSVRAVYGQNCFHHFPDPSKFFNELDRVLIPGGGAVLIEPYYGPLANFLYNRMFQTEQFDKTAPSWKTPVAGPMSGANQALSYMVFVRDRMEFERRHPTLKIVHQSTCTNHLRYLLSGGLNFKQLCPDILTPMVDLIQWILSPFNPLLSLHHMIVIRKDI